MCVSVVVCKATQNIYVILQASHQGRFVMAADVAAVATMRASKWMM